MRDATAKRADTEAAAWFARLSKLSVTTDSLREFREWKRDPDNAAAYAAVEATWEAGRPLELDPEIVALTRATLDKRRPRKGRRSLLLPALLTGVGVLTGAAAAVVWFQVQALTTYTTGVGEQRLVVLSDGSKVRLNTDSAIRVRLGGGARHVELARGEAFFDVRHDPAHPFLVSSDGARISDLGTRFDVRRTAGAVHVTLVDGRVSVSTAGQAQPVALAPNQRLVVSSEGISAPKPVDALQAASWTTGRLVFQSTPLQEAVAEVNRYATRKVVLEPTAELAQQPVSGVFDTGDTTAFVAAVKTLFALDATTAPDGSIRLQPARKTPAA
jgi:transmembrane sensor